MTEINSSFAQRGGTKIHFEHEDMDYYLGWIMGREIYGASQADECLATAERIEDGNAGSWRQEWCKLAQAVEGRAQENFERGQVGAAADLFLRACSYYRAAMFIMLPWEPQFRPTAEAMRRCFDRSEPGRKPPLQRIEIGFSGKSLPGIYWPAGGSDQPAPTLIVIGGIETFLEDCFFMVGPTVHEKGYNFLSVDLPGQGFSPYQGLHFNARMEKPMAPVLKYLHSRLETDPSRIALYGFSWGGHIAFKTARHDQRVKAMIANPAMPNVFRAALLQQGGRGRSDPIAQAVFQQIAWRMGLKISFNPVDIARRFGKAYDYLFHGKVNPADVEQPTLCLAGEGEPAITLQITEECRQRLPHPASRVITFGERQGSSAHCQVDNLMVPNSAIFDWLAELGW